MTTSANLKSKCHVARVGQGGRLKLDCMHVRASSNLARGKYLK